MGAVPFSPCRPAPIRLYEVCRARFTRFFTVSIFILFAVLAMPTCVSDGNGCMLGRVYCVCRHRDPGIVTVAEEK